MALQRETFHASYNPDLFLRQLRLRSVTRVPFFLKTLTLILDIFTLWFSTKYAFQSMCLRWTVSNTQDHQRYCCFFSYLTFTAQKMKFSIKNFVSKCDQIRSFLRIWSHLWRNPLWKTSFFIQYCVINLDSFYRGN